VVIPSNHPAWRFLALEGLSEQARAELVEVRKYAEQALQLPTLMLQLTDRQQPVALGRRSGWPAWITSGNASPDRRRLDPAPAA
jgi:C4-dicarboxylate-specific signal transduction histidine kinase